MLDLDIRYDRLKGRGVVYHILTTVYESLIVEIDKSLLNEIVGLGIKCKSLMFPTHRGSHASHLFLDIASVFIDPLPAFSEEFFSSHLLAVGSCLLHALLDSCLCCDPSMIGSRNPESGVTTHTMIARHDILECEREGMSDVEVTGDVRRRDRYIKSLSTRGLLR